MILGLFCWSIDFTPFLEVFFQFLCSAKIQTQRQKRHNFLHTRAYYFVNNCEQLILLMYHIGSPKISSEVKGATPAFKFAKFYLKAAFITEPFLLEEVVWSLFLPKILTFLAIFIKKTLNRFHLLQNRGWMEKFLFKKGERCYVCIGV